MSSISKTSNLSVIKPFKSTWRVQVKILHTWKSFTPQFGASLEMVLADENGVKIHASCKQPFVEQFERYCRVGEWKVITNMALSPASGLYRPTCHVFTMSFLKQTSITESDLKCDNMFLDLQDFASILSGSHNTCYLIDVMGEVLDLGDLGKFRYAGKEVNKVDFTLRDINNQRLQCCIWGESADFLTKEFKESNKGVICLIRFAKLGKYRGEFQVSNACDSSVVLFNPEIKEAQALKQMFHGDDISIDLYQPEKDKILIQRKREKWSQFPFNTIQGMKHTNLAGNIRVICHVYAIDTFLGWYYVACIVCNKKVLKMNLQFEDQNVPNWWCEFCQRFVTKVSPRYNLHLLVQDQTGESNLLLQDSVAKSFVKSSAAKILSGFADEVEGREVLPGAIVDIVGKTYGFGISIDEDNISNGVDHFKVLKVWNLDDILFKKIKSLHQIAIETRKKQRTDVINNGKMDTEDTNEKKSG